MTRALWRLVWRQARERDTPFIELRHYVEQRGEYIAVETSDLIFMSQQANRAWVERISVDPLTLSVRERWLMHAKHRERIERQRIRNEKKTCIN